MWKPAEVVSQHKHRAIALWLGLIAAIFAYSTYLVCEAVEKSKNPSTSFVLSNDMYRYPDVYVCLYDFFGCDTMDLEEECMASAQMTEGGLTKATFNPGGDNEQELETEGFLTDNRGWCVYFDAASVTIPKGGRDPEDYILLDMYWYPGGGANKSTTCIAEEGEWESHSESVFVFLRDSETSVLSAGVQMAYSCMTSASNSHVFNYMGIGLTKEIKITGEHTATYQALATSSAVYKDKRNSNITSITSPYAYLSMEIAQTTDSLEIITEIDPLEIAEIFGNIGGFWDLLLIFWPLFFVTTASPGDPHLKVRDFREVIERGTQSLKFGGRKRPREQEENGGDEQIPHWDDVARGVAKSPAIAPEPVAAAFAVQKDSPWQARATPGETSFGVVSPPPSRGISRTSRHDFLDESRGGGSRSDGAHIERRPHEPFARNQSTCSDARDYV